MLEEAAEGQEGRIPRMGSARSVSGGLREHLWEQLERRTAEKTNVTEV